MVRLYPTGVSTVEHGTPRPLGRVTLWMVPAIAMGLCAALELVRRRLSARAALRACFDVVVYGGAVLVLVSALGVHRSYSAGARLAIQKVIASAGPGDAVVITRPTTYSFALYGETPVEVRPTPERQIGFLPEFSDERFHPHDFTTTTEEMDAFVIGADRVFVVHANVGQGYSDYLFTLALDLALRGFERESTTTIGTGQVDVWRPSLDARQVELLQEQLRNASPARP